MSLVSTSDRDQWGLILPLANDYDDYRSYWLVVRARLSRAFQLDSKEPSMWLEQIDICLLSLLILQAPAWAVAVVYP